MKEKRRAALIFVAANAAIVLIAVIYVLIFLRSDGAGIFVCPFKDTLFIYCPGCGGTRSVYYLLTLDFVNSFIYNPAVPITALILLDIDIRAVISIIKTDMSALRSFRGKIFYLIPIVILVNFVLRNILLYRFGIDLLGDFGI